MIDHVLGRPSTQFRKFQVFAVVSFWSLYVVRGNKHGPPVLRNISTRLSKHLTAWQTLVLTLLYLYICRNFAKIFGLESPEPLANLYSRSYFRATWITTALDAGFWTAMKIKTKWLRDIASIVFTIHYMIAAEQADEKVRKVRGLLTVDHLRVSWNKSTTPYLNLLSKLLRPRLTSYGPRALRIPRPSSSSYEKPIDSWMYFDGPLSSLKNHSKIILDIPGGGFVSMSPRHHEDRLLAWAGRTGLPIISLDYGKAPEYPYPYAIYECFDAYRTICGTRGRCLGLSGNIEPRIVLTGDSAGGNLVTVLTLLLIQAINDEPHSRLSRKSITMPEGLILMYPNLDMNIGNWMSDDQMALIQDQRMRKTNRNILRRKSEDYHRVTETPHQSDEEDFEADDSPTSEANTSAVEKKASKQSRLQPKGNATGLKPTILRTRLAVSSMISYFNDRILTPEMMRAMIILYVGPHHRPDFSTDYLLSPLLAPEALLADFPRTYFLTGERDPLVDDTVIFAGRIRQAKLNDFIQRKELGLVRSSDEFDEKDHVHVALIPGVSHGFLQFLSFFPPGWKYLYHCTNWIDDLFDSNDISTTPFTPGKSDSTRHDSSKSTSASNTHLKHPTMTTTAVSTTKPQPHHRRKPTESSGEEDNPLMMTSSRPGPTLGATKALRRNGHGRGKRVRHADSTIKRSKSLVSLGSETDLMTRRMRGLTGGLMGLSSDGTVTP